MEHHVLLTLELFEADLLTAVVSQGKGRCCFSYVDHGFSFRLCHPGAGGPGTRLLGRDARAALRRVKG